MTLGRSQQNSNTRNALFIKKLCSFIDLQDKLLALAAQGAYKRNMKFSATIRPYKSADLTGFLRVFVAGQPVGWTKPEFAALLDSFNDTWFLRDNALHMNDALADFDTRAKAIDDTFVALSDQGHIPAMPDYSMLGGIDWFPIYSGQDIDRLALVRRFYAPYLGIHFKTVMVHGYHDNRYWAAKRGKIVEGAPGMMDIMVAGAVRHDQTLEEAVLDEGYAEAGISRDWLPDIRHKQDLELYYLNDGGFFINETFHIYEFDTKGEFTPRTNLPLEVEGFQEYSMHDLLIAVQHGGIFKGQINMVLTDFLIRHGYLTKDHPDFEESNTLLYLHREM